MAIIKVGVGFFVTSYTIDPSTLACAVEDAGFESLWVPDHPVFPSCPETPYPSREDGAYPQVFGEMADPFVLLAWCAATTRSLRLGTAVTLVTERHPLTLAKTISTLDRFSSGRLLLGAGTGNLREDLAMYGTDWKTRWTYVGESVEAMKQLWSTGQASYDGELISFPEVRCDPLPAQRPGPPVLVGSRLNDWTIERVARWGDGWIPPGGARPQHIERGRRLLEQRYRELGRDPSIIDITVFFAMDLTRETRRAYEEAGATRIVAQLYNHPGEPIAMDRWREARVASLGGPDGPRPTPEETLNALERLREMAFD